MEYLVLGGVALGAVAVLMHIITWLVHDEPSTNDIVSAFEKGYSNAKQDGYDDILSPLYVMYHPSQHPAIRASRQIGAILGKVEYDRNAVKRKEQQRALQAEFDQERREKREKLYADVLATSMHPEDV